MEIDGIMHVMRERRHDEKLNAIHSAAYLTFNVTLS